MIEAPLCSTYSHTSTHYYVRLLSTATLDDVQPMRTLEAVLWKHLYLQFPVFDANTVAYKNCGGYFSKENDCTSGFMVVQASGYQDKYSEVVTKLFGEHQFFHWEP